MNNSLLKVLIDRNIIGVRTEIDARYRGRDIAGHALVASTGTFLILEIQNSDTGYRFLCADVIDGSRRLLAGDAIVGVDGMDPIRLAANYEIDEDGNRIKVGKRRGRKPRAVLEAMAANG
jgi:hypothetical protein